MANASLQSFLHQQHHRHSFLSSGSIHECPLKLTTNNASTTTTGISFKLLSSSAVTKASSSAPTPVVPAAAATTTTTSAPPPPPSLALLGRHLADGDYRQADETTRALIIHLAGDAARRRGYVFFSEVQFIPAEELRAIDALWRQHSGGRFGYSVQRQLWEKSRRDYTRFFIKVGWMKKLETEVEQFNYRAFPDEFTWELSNGAPEGHLPLTNALRGTRLLESLFTHPAFQEEEEEEEESEDDGKGRERTKIVRELKPDYSF